MKITVGEREFDGTITVTDLMRIEGETQKSIARNGADPSITFMVSTIAAAISTEEEVIPSLWVSKRLDPSNIEYYAQVTNSLLEHALNPFKQDGNVVGIKK